ncbi:MAG: response regulator [Rhizobiaceae bacterium]|nr:response regulator [Rhizobiaceae bacterium]MCV0405355.1 response regulator [Rhizobiaceae bacterium]
MIPNNRSDERALILCVEDEDDLRTDLVEELEEAGYAVIEAQSGQQALEQLETIRPDLILCDINMPGGNGYDVMRDIRARRPEFADVPFIFLTALADPREVVEGKRSGADDYLVKPVDFDLLLATVAAHLRQVERVRQKVASDMDRLRGALAGLHDDVDPDTYRGIAGVLDHIALGVVLLDGECRLRFANRAAHELTADAYGLRIDDELRLSRAEHRQALHDAISEAATAKREGRDGVVCLRISRPSGRRDLLLVASPLAAPKTVEGPKPAVIIFLADPERRPQLREEMLATWFGLTPTESQVALRIAEGARPGEIATALGVSETTIAYHMRNIFQKTDTHRQVELVALVLAGPMALVPG